MPASPKSLGLLNQVRERLLQYGQSNLVPLETVTLSSADGDVVSIQQKTTWPLTTPLPDEPILPPPPILDSKPRYRSLLWEPSPPVSPKPTLELSHEARESKRIKSGTRSPCERPFLRTVE